MESSRALPQIIQGGMGINISGWKLARAVSLAGQLGTVSGTVTERLMTRILQKGDPGGDIRRALAHFPYPEVAKKIVDMYYVEGGIPKGKPFKGTPVFSVTPSPLLVMLTVCASFAYVWLAKEKNPNPVSVNYLEKIAMPHVYAITGAMLADVDFITMGAGIPIQIPKAIEDIAEGREASYPVPVIGQTITSHKMTFDPGKFFGSPLPPMRKPGFIPIVASNSLASYFINKLPSGSIFGFVVEEPTAGGHNAPPRKKQYNEKGELLPLYGEKDVVNYAAIADLGLPFWIGGSHASPAGLRWARSVGAAGIQAGTIFLMSDDSSVDPEIRRQLRREGYEGRLVVETDMRISPTGFPFKKAVLEGTISDPAIYAARTRVCSQGALVSLYEKPDGTIGSRCPSEPIDAYVKKGGDPMDCMGRGCLCNGLATSGGLGDEIEPPVVTMGDDYSFLPFLMRNAEDSYSADDAIQYLLSA